MKKLQLIKPGIMMLVLAWFLGVGSFAQETVAFWNFGTSGAETLAPTTGTGTATLIGGTTSTWAGGVTGQGWNTASYPAQGTLSGTAGVEFAVSTAARQNIVLTWSQRHSNTAANRIRLMYTIDGTTWLNFEASVVNASNVRVQEWGGFDNGRYIAHVGDDWFHRVANFTSISGVNNNPLFAVRIVTEFADGTNYSASAAASTYGASGTLRFDDVRFMSNPESWPFSTYFHLALVNNTRPTWFGTDLERGGAVHGNFFYAASRNVGLHVRKLDRLTGLEVATLNTTGISGGTFALNDIEVSEDGQRIAFNLITAGGDFKAYLLDETAPAQVLFSTNITAGRYGDKVTLVGRLSDGSAKIYAANGLTTEVLKWNMIPTGPNTWAFDPVPETITLTEAVLGATPAVAPLPDGSFYWNANGQSLSKHNADGTRIGVVPGTIVATGSNAMKFLGKNGSDEYLAVYLFGAHNETIRVLRIPNGVPANAQIEFTTPTLRGGGGANANGTGDIGFVPYLDGNVGLYILATNNGIGGYKSNNLNITSPVYPAPIVLACEAPTGLNTTLLSHNSATIGWQGAIPEKNITGWQFAFGVAPFLQPTGAGTSTSQPVATLTGLTPQTNYQFWVRSVCVGGIFSDWVGHTFTTTAAVCNAPTALAATNITATGAHLGWTVGGAETAWEYVVGPSPLAAPTGAGIATTTNPVLVTGLTTNTAHQFYVRANCDPGNLSPWAGPFTFTTRLAVPAPHFQGFATTAVPAGWTLTGWTIGTVAAIPAFDGNYIRRNLWSTAPTGTFTTVPIGPVMSGMRLTFNYALANFSTTAPQPAPPAGSGNFVVSISTDFGATFGPIQTIPNNGVGGWQSFDLDLASYVGQTISVRIDGNWTSGDYFLAFDNFSVSLPVTCAAPNTLAATNITATSAHLGWTAGSNQTAWEYVVGPSPLAEPTGAGIATTTNPVLVTGLASNTAHQFYVRANCGSGDLSTWAGPFTFTTRLAVPAPHFQGFATTAVPAGWTLTGWTIGTVAAIPALDGNYIRRNLWSTAPTGTFTTVHIGPVMSGMRLTFNYALANFSTTAPQPAPPAGSGNFVVSISTNFGATFSPIQTIPNNGVGGWQSFDLDLASYVGQTISVRIDGNRTSGDYFLAFDNFSVSQPITCPAPTALAATNITTTSAHLGWTVGGAETAWEYVVGPSPLAAPTGAGIATTVNPVPVTGLLHSTNYQFYVRAVCGTNDVSTWAGPFTFQTACATLAVPLAQNFDTTPAGLVPPPCWSTQTATNLWRVSTSGAPVSPPHAMVTFFHTTLPKNDWFFTPGLNLTAGKTYSIEFKVRAPGWAGIAERLKVHIGTAANSAAMSATPLWDNQSTLYPTWTTINFTHVPTVSGVYFIGWHAYSVADIDFIAVDDISITEVDTTVAVTFDIKNQANQPIPNAVVTLGNVINPAGNYVFTVDSGNYSYSVMAHGYIPVFGNVVVGTTPVTVSITMQEPTPQQTRWVNQPIWDGGTAVTSVIDNATPIDFELADNFWGVNGQVNQMVFYGLAMKFVGTTWVPQIPAATEPFLIRFYQYQTGVDQLLAPVTGTYRLALIDSFGDGWNGGTVTVRVNGIPVLSNITLATGAGPVYHNFTANQGDAISTIYTAGSWPAENYYAILDPSDNIIAQQGGTWTNPGASTPGNVGTGAQTVLEPNWANPLSVHALTATVETVGTIWNGTRTLYKFTVNFPQPINLPAAWVSAQINANTGSGTWFLWLNSQVGDQFSWHRTAAVGGSKLRGVDQPDLDSTEPEKAIFRPSRNHDLAFELWGPAPASAPSCVTYVAPANQAVNQPKVVTLSWNAAPGALGYLLFIGETLPNVGMNVGNVTSFQVTVDYSKTYQWRIVPYNAYGMAPDCTVRSFTTMANPTLFPPFTQNFNTTPFPPANWERLRGLLTANTVFTTGALWTHKRFANIAAPAPNAASINIFSTREHWLITPPVDLGNGSINYRLTFDIALTGWNNTNPASLGLDDYVAVVISTDEGLTWSNANVLQHWDRNSTISNTGNQIVINLTGRTGLVKFGFYAERPTGTTPDIDFFIDNVTVEPIPACPNPMSITVANITSTSATLGWTNGGTETAWEYAVGVSPLAAPTGAGIATATNPVVLTGLQPGTTYHFYVRANCGSSSFSPWVGPFTFTTVFAPPFAQDFNTTPFPPLQWQMLRGLLAQNTQFVAGAVWTHKRFANIAAPAPNAASINIFGTREHWLMTPSIDLGDGTKNYRMTFDIALTGWNNTNPASLGLDDYVAVVISTDNGQTWSNTNVLQYWDRNSTISNTGQQVIVDLSGRSGMVRFGFYAERPTGNTPDIDFFIDNVIIEEIPTTPVFVVAPTSHNFGNVEVGATSSPRSFTITNRGIGTVTVNAPTVSGALGNVSFNPAHFPAQLGAFQSVTFNATITAPAQGPFADNIAISYNDGSAKVANVPINGTGVVRIPGSTCFSPMVMTLPIVNYLGNTELFGNDYNSTMITPASSYLNGNDFVIQFTVNQPGLLTGSVAGSWTGLLVMQNCPNPVNPAATIATGVGASGGSFTNVLIQPGTYFAIVSTWPTPNFTAFTLNLSFQPLFTVSFNVTDAHTGLAIQGARIAIAGQPTLTTNSAGQASLLLTPSSYTAAVSKEQYVTANQPFTVVNSNVTVNVALVDDIQPPFGLRVTTTGLEGGQALFSWNNIDGLAGFADSFESGNFNAWATYVQGPGTPGEAGQIPHWHVPAAGTAPHGTRFAHCGWGFNINTNIITPPLAVTATSTLRFWWNTSYHWHVSPNNNGTLFVRISTDNGASWTTLWTEDAAGVFANWTWYQTTIPLGAYAGTSAIIAFNHIQNDGATYSIDNIVFASGGKNPIGTFAMSTPADVPADARMADMKDVVFIGAEKAFVGYNVFFNNMTTPVAFTQGLNHMFNMVPPGLHTAGVQAVYSSGVSQVVTIDFNMPGPNITFVVTQKLGYNNFAPIAGANVHFNGEVKQTNAQGRATFFGVPHGLRPYEIFHNMFFPSSGALIVGFPHMTVPVTLTVNNTNVEEPTLADIKVFPVPARTVLNITSPENMKQLQVVNMLGQVVYTAEEVGVRHEINVAGIRDGMYVLRIITEIGIETRTIQIIK